MTSLEVKTTLTQLFLLSVLRGLPEWKQDNFLQGEGMPVYCKSFYKQKLGCLIVCYTVSAIPPMLAVNSPLLCNHRWFSPAKYLRDRNTDLLSFIYFKICFILLLFFFPKGYMGVKEIVAKSVRNSSHPPTPPPILQRRSFKVLRRMKAATS